MSDSSANVFNDVYTNRRWGAPLTGQDYFSGTGSHTPRIVEAYVRCIEELFASLPEKPVILDVGCGDFNVGAKLTRLCRKYTGMDIVPELINRNNQSYATANVAFVSRNAVTDELPDADVVFVRQVFQHLSNQDVRAILDKLKNYQHIIITEHHPVNKHLWRPNIDIRSGADTRLGFGSGVYVTQPPFNVPVAEVRTLLEVPDVEGIGVLQTILWTPGKKVG